MTPGDMPDFDGTIYHNSGFALWAEITDANFCRFNIFFNFKVSTICHISNVLIFLVRTSYPM